MPGFELIGREELAEIEDLFSKSNGVMFAHGFVAQRNGRFRVREFEAALAARFKSAHCQVVSSGTAAQYVAMKAAGIGPGDEVITQAFTFVATLEAIVECGATPIVVDVDASLNMCPRALENAITPRTKAIVPVHMLGNPARMEEINAVAKKAAVPVFEDACEALGATYRGKMLGTLGKCGFFSLDFGKVLTTGEGGFILTDDLELYKLMSEYHDHGHENRPGLPRGRDTARIAGFNFRMSDLQAAVGLAQLRKLDVILEANRRNKAYLKERLAPLVGALEFRDITDPVGELADTLMFFLPNADVAAKVVAQLATEGIGTKNVPDAMDWHFARSWGHLWKHQPRYANTWKTEWNASAALLDRCVSLPIMVKSTPPDLERIADAVTRAVRKHA